MLAFLQLIRISNLLIIALALSLFYWFILVPAHHYKLFTYLLPFTTWEFVLFVLSVAMVAAAGNTINDYFDFELDKSYKPYRPLPSGKISLDNAMYLHAAFALGGIALGFYLGWRAGNFKIGYLYVISALLLYLYSSYLKKIPLAGNITISALTGFVFVLLMLFEAAFLNTIYFEGSRFVMDMLLWQVGFYGGFAFLTNLIREVVKDLEDMDGDSAFNIGTFPVAFGEKAGKILTAVLVVVLLFCLSYFQMLFVEGKAWKQFTYILLLVQLPLLLVFPMLIKAKVSADYKKLSWLLKAVMVLGILSIPSFYLFNRFS
ncbi:MAG: geranylgeranylglycerol-phosphate geranylgeranyltransferase [Chitinophagales bacterium]|nr:geranylgeranylglycerol-phosphate geranylgeranyltransferase [Chitinophagales bacterium]